MGVTGKNVPKMPKKRVRLAIRRGSYLGPPWTVLAEILGDNRPIVGLSWVQISLGCVEARRSSVRKRPKNGPKNRFFEKVPYRYDGEIFFISHSNGPLGVPDVQKKIQPRGGFFGFGRVRS